MNKILFCSASLFSLVFAIPTEKIIRTTHCPCDTAKIKSIILNKDFNRIQRFDTISYSQENFDNLSNTIKTLLWYRDIESPTPTQFTKFWSSGRFRRLVKTNIPTKLINRDSAFLDSYSHRKDVELAFKLGPNFLDLLAYHYFIVKKVDSCYLFTHSYDRHARLTSKSYSIINHVKLDSLRKLLFNIKMQKFSGQQSIGYAGYFVDNRYNHKLFIDFEKGKDVLIGPNTYRKEIQDLFDFVDKKIDWRVTYPE